MLSLDYIARGRHKLSEEVLLERAKLALRIRELNAVYSKNALRRLKNGLNSVEAPEYLSDMFGVTPSQQERLRKALRACVTVRGE